MLDAAYALICFSAAAFATMFLSKEFRRQNGVKKTKSWPVAEATVLSGSVEAVRHLRFGEIYLPVFDLTYVVRQKSYSDRFALSMCSEPVDALMNKMVGRRMSVQYDPENPGTCYIPADKVEGCRIEQNIGSQVKFHPRSQA